jgi:hypothetical protein
MTLTMRPTGLGTGIYKDDFDYNVFSGDWLIGRIYERRGFAPDVRWEWSVHGIVLTRPPGIRTNGAAATLEAAKAEFGRAGSGGLSGRGWKRLADTGIVGGFRRSGRSGQILLNHA